MRVLSRLDQRFDFDVAPNLRWWWPSDFVSGKKKLFQHLLRRLLFPSDGGLFSTFSLRRMVLVLLVSSPVMSLIEDLRRRGLGGEKGRVGGVIKSVVVSVARDEISGQFSMKLSH